MSTISPKRGFFLGHHVRQNNIFFRGSMIVERVWRLSALKLFPCFFSTKTEQGNLLESVLEIVTKPDCFITGNVLVFMQKRGNIKKIWGNSPLGNDHVLPF